MYSIQYHRRHVFAAACVGMHLFGIVSSNLGTILTWVLERFAVGKAQADSVFVILNLPQDRSVGKGYLGVFFGIGAFGLVFILGFLLDCSRARGSSPPWAFPCPR